ncbi:Homeobox-leucine zipper protein HDG11 [Seiridium cupressi]
MLVTRQPDTESSHWSSKYQALLHKPTSPRMSNFEGPLSSQPEWQGHYSYLPPGEPNIFAQPFQQVSGPNASNNAATVPPPSSVPNAVEASNQSGPGAAKSPVTQSHPIDPQGLRAPKVESPVNEGAESPVVANGIKTESIQEESSESVAPAGPTNLNALGSTEQGQEISHVQSGHDDAVLSKEEDDDIVDDDEMLDVEGDGEVDMNRPMTAAERTAARRKMKRFRLTHQQTRFLMSEFAKQPHPDAAHRERLSREIPGLSPRQVQVWFQNRRAKIKRLTADDRDRMIKMRAVPDDFDNVQALHSPYGAVHTINTPPITPHVEFGTQSYAEHMMRPLMLDTVRRGDGDANMSPSGLSPSYGGMGFPQSGSMSSSDMLSPLSTSSHDRGYYSSHLASPLSSGPRTSNPFARQSSLDNGMQMQSRQQIRPLQPLQLRETMSRSRSDTMQSPLRTSMSWKGDAIDYGYPNSSASPAIGGRHQSVYSSEQGGSTSNNGLSYESGSYSAGAIQSSPTHINYSSLPATLQHPPQNTRLRAATATLPLNLDLRTQQYRSVSSGHNMQGAGPATPRATSATPYSTAYTSSFPSAPLTAPIDFAQPRTPGIGAGVRDYSMPQMSAPIAPPQDFSHALHGNLGGHNTRTPMRDSFTGSALSTSQSHGSERSDEYSHDNYAMKRKRSFSNGPNPQAYQHAS